MVRSKTVEAHIKQYRCMKDPKGCDKPMTSRAIRFRHEREQHGSCKHNCLFGDCSRAKDGAGFPRAYNRNDHMRRAHGWVPETDHKKKTATKPDRKRKRDTQKTAVQKRALQKDKKATKEAAPTTAEARSTVPVTAAPSTTAVAPSFASLAIGGTDVPSSQSRPADKAIATVPATYNVPDVPAAPAPHSISAPHVNDTTTPIAGPYAALTNIPTWNLATTSANEGFDDAERRWEDLRYHVINLVHQIQNVQCLDAMEYVAQQGPVLRDMARDIQARFLDPGLASLQPWNPSLW